jgi:endonuclease/exonuclease/phosphatase family metal-dependent hydrolase
MKPPGVDYPMKSIRTITLNTWAKYGPFKKRWTVMLQELKQLDFDLLFLQEVCDHELLDKIYDQMKQPHVQFNPTQQLALLSRYPIQSDESIPYKAQSASEKFERGALISKVNIDRLTIVTANTHLSWRNEDRFIRVDQSNELLLKLQKLNKPTIIAGDFNDVTESAPIENLKINGYVDIYRSATREKNGMTWDNANPFIQRHDVKFPDRRIDFLFANDLLTSCSQVRLSELAFNHASHDGIFASDHYGIHSIIDLKDT